MASNRGEQNRNKTNKCRGEMLVNLNFIRISNRRKNMRPPSAPPVGCAFCNRSITPLVFLLGVYKKTHSQPPPKPAVTMSRCRRWGRGVPGRGGRGSSSKATTRAPPDSRSLRGGPKTGPLSIGGAEANEQTGRGIDIPLRAEMREKIQAASKSVVGIVGCVVERGVLSGLRSSEK